MLEKVYAYVVEATKLELSDQGNSLYISEQLQLSRNMVSQYLNQLFAEGRLLKINTRPVVFYDGDTIEAVSYTHLLHSSRSVPFRISTRVYGVDSG